MNTVVTRFISEYAASEKPAEYVLKGRYAERPRGILISALKRFNGSVVAASGKQRVVMHRGQVAGGFQVNLTSLSGVEAYEASRSTTVAKAYFSSVGVPVPRGRSFSPRRFQEALEYLAGWKGAPLVLKPSTTTGGRGVVRGIRTAQDLEKAWEIASAVRVRGLGGTNELILEEQIEGIDVRAFIAGERVVAATARIPLFAVGDGRRNLAQLTDRALRSRTGNPVLLENPISRDDILKANALDPSEVPAAGEVTLLSSRVGLQDGGLTVDVTDAMSPELRELAVRAAWSVPGCPVTGVDLLVPSLNSSEDAVVLQIDVEAPLAVHHFPWVGSTRPVAEAVARSIIRHGRN
ncbi:hypothetical protein [Nesterenkonia flava]|uniref:ATP-grasp domain-containing protein n=1 Tax=Nesterenkonia flava TaxID=469799 RepID=A0ABU1FSQ3_9MICC|nr:hypothetical protein [Nesterenkonia flava]MDR5711691.1 hypothetical protein [Nesterenkonia flava]